MGDKSISGIINWGRQSGIGKVIGVERGDKDEGRIKFADLGVALAGCASNYPPPAKDTTVVIPPSNGTTTVVVPQTSRAAELCRDGTRPPCY